MDTLSDGTFVLTVTVSVKRLTPDLHSGTRHYLLLHGQAMHERVRARRGVRLVPQKRVEWEGAPL